MKRTLMIAGALATAIYSMGATQPADFQKWAQTPPMGWNSWDCYGPTVVESEVKANADYMAKNLKEYGWEYVVVDIRWYVENDKAGGYNQTNPKYVYDEWGRYTPALNRFPSAKDGAGFKPLADYVHEKGLKFGIHIMRGIPNEAVKKKLPVKGTDGITANMIANTDSTCTWLRDNHKVDFRKEGAQQYYNSIFDLYAEWGVDFVKVDDLSRPYHTAEIEMIRHAIDQCGRPMVLSVSPGETPLDKVEHVRANANMWRTVDDFWDNWSQLNYQFGVCAKWAPYIQAGGWPDADMLPLGRISIRGERGQERQTNFTADEQKTLMNLWTIFRSPLMFGGNLPQNDAATDKLLTNKDVLYMHHYSAGNREVSHIDNSILWSAIDPMNGDRFAALFNVGGNEFINTRDALWRSGTISYLTTGHASEAEVALPADSKQLVLVVTDGGDSYDCDHADWINPVLVMADGSEQDLTKFTILRNTCGWGETHVNTNLNGGKLSVNGTKYDKGFATHANSVLIFDLPENAVKFKTITGLDNTGTNQDGSKSSVEFFAFNYDPTMRVENTDQWQGGNKQINVDPAKQAATGGYQSRKSAQRLQHLETDIKDTEKLYLVVTNGGDDLSYDHADWINPVLVKADGTEVSLTTINWDANPINGWNDPKVNKNNDGNRMTVDGVGYDYGFGVNAPSMLTFTLPQGHDYVSFKVDTALDDDINNAPQGATVEFRVYTQNPEPDTAAVMPLNLESLGFAPEAKAEITDMWTGEKLGTVKGNEYAPTVPGHGSVLVRVSPTERQQSAKVTMVYEECDCEKNHKVFDVKVDGAGEEQGYIVLLCDDNIVSVTPLEKGDVLCWPEVPGTHEYKAVYSGTLTVAPAESEPVKVTISGVKETVDENNQIEIIPGVGSIKVKSTMAGMLPIYSVDGRLVKNVKLGEDLLMVNLEAGVYVAGKHKFYVM